MHSLDRNRSRHTTTREGKCGGIRARARRVRDEVDQQNSREIPVFVDGVSGCVDVVAVSTEIKNLGGTSRTKGLSYDDGRVEDGPDGPCLACTNVCGWCC